MYSHCMEYLSRHPILILELPEKFNAPFHPLLTPHETLKINLNFIYLTTWYSAYC